MFCLFYMGIGGLLGLGMVKAWGNVVVIVLSVLYSHIIPLIGR